MKQKKKKTNILITYTIGIILMKNENKSFRIMFRLYIIILYTVLYD